MKQFLSIFILLPLCAIAMEEPSESTPAQIEQAARRALILNGPNAELHRLTSFVWAYMHPHDMEFNEQAIRFPHYKHAFMKYTMRWEDAYKQLAEWRQELLDADIANMAARLTETMFKNGPCFRLTKKEKLSFTKHHFQIFEKNKDNHGVLTPALLTARTNYRQAFSNANWRYLSNFNQNMHRANHANQSFTEFILICEAVMLHQFISKAEEVVNKDKVSRLAATIMALKVAESELPKEENNGGWCAII